MATFLVLNVTTVTQPTRRETMTKTERHFCEETINVFDHLDAVSNFLLEILDISWLRSVNYLFKIAHTKKSRGVKSEDQGEPLHCTTMTGASHGKVFVQPTPKSKGKVWWCTIEKYEVNLGLLYLI